MCAKGKECCKEPRCICALCEANLCIVVGENCKIQGHYVKDGMNFCLDCWEKRQQEVRDLVAETR